MTWMTVRSEASATITNDDPGPELFSSTDSPMYIVHPQLRMHHQSWVNQYSDLKMFVGIYEAIPHHGQTETLKDAPHQFCRKIFWICSVRLSPQMTKVAV